MRTAVTFLLILSLSLSTLAAATANQPAKQLKGTVSVSVKNGKSGKKVSRQELYANPAYMQAVLSFQDKNYAAALKDFQLLDSTGYCCDLVHYYIGQCYQNTNQTVAAQQHYDWVVERSKDPTLKAYANYANESLAYYSSHRTYSGQGNNFAPANSGGGGGGGRVGFG